MSTTTVSRAFRGFLGATALAATMVVGATTTASAQDIEQITDEYLFSQSLSEFTETRSQQPYPDQLVWTSDACTSSPDVPFGFDFTPACHRHDFGYGNYRRQDRFTEANRLRIDDQFYDDLLTICDGAWQCEATAWVYYQAVREFGGN